MEKNLLILSGGVGTRFNSELPKQYHLDSKGKTIFQRSVENFEPDLFTNVVVVCDAKYINLIKKILISLSFNSILFAEQGKDRQTSINNGVKSLCDIGVGSGQLFIQESVRPFVTKKLVNDLINVPEEFPNVAPAINPVVLYGKGTANGITELIQKNELFELQLPKRYDFCLFKKLLVDTDIDTNKTLDESEYFIKNDIPVKTIEGDQANIKITYFKDKEIL